MVTMSNKRYRQRILYDDCIVLKFVTVGEMKDVFLGTGLRTNLQGKTISVLLRLLYGDTFLNKDHQYILTFSAFSPNSVTSEEIISKDI